MALGSTLLLLKGPLAVGKSSLARVLGRCLGWPVVDKDDASDVLMACLENYGPAAYGVMFAQTKSLLEGFSVIVDSPLRGEVGLKNALKIAGRHADVKVLECFCSDKEVWRERLETRQRRPAHVLKTWADFETYWQTAERDYNYPVAQPLLKLDMMEPLEANVVRAAKWLSD